LGSSDQENHGLRLARQIVLETPIFKITRAKWTEDMLQAVEYLLCKHKAPSSNPSHTKKKKKKKKKETKQKCTGAKLNALENEAEFQSHPYVDGTYRQ
jgi:hypothetical protein